MSSPSRREQSAKRQKTAIACNPCKSKKSRCDGARPVCGVCSKKAHAQYLCMYRDNLPDHSLMFPNYISNGYLPEPKAHSDASLSEASSGATTALRPYAIASSENSPLDLNNSCNSLNPPLAPELLEQGPINNMNCQFKVPKSTELHALRADTQSPESVETDGTEVGNEGDAMGCVDNRALNAGLLGTSSGASFMRHIRDFAASSNSPDQGSKGAMSGHVSAPLRSLKHQSKRRRESRSTQFILPTRKIADHLTKIYWDYSHSIFPWPDKSEMTKSYNLLWMGDEDPLVDEQVFHCTLNLMFALGCVLDPDGFHEEQSKFSKVYFERANELLSFNLLDFSYFSLIQTFLLMTLYLQSTKMPRKCFQSIGMAVWIAQDLGLHLPETTSSMEDVREREFARRIWHGCILMDRIAAMAFGRPARISQNVAKKAILPLAIYEEQSINQPPILDFYISYCQLHLIMGDMLLSLYTSVGENSTGSAKVKDRSFLEILDELIKFDGRLLEWRKDVKLHLQFPSNYQDSTEILLFTRQSNVLHARWLHARVLLFRPLFSYAFHSRDNFLEKDAASLDSHVKSLVASHCVVMCVISAQQIIELIHDTLRNEERRHTLPPCWYNITYVYNAASVVIAAHMLPSVLEKTPISELGVSLQQAFYILRLYEPLQAASKCKDALDAIYSKVVMRSAERPNISHEQMQESQQPDMELLGIGTVNMNWGDGTAYLSAIGSEDLAWLDNPFFDWSNHSAISDRP